VQTLADMTICSVSFGDWPLIELNRRLCERLNPKTRVRWRVVRNLPAQPSDMAAGGDDVEVIDGESLDETARAASKHRSYHHALGLNRACRDLQTRYLALVDADCFVVRPHWVRDVLNHMRDRGLAFFGVPYHPRSIAKVRYFPCAVFSVIDTRQVPADALDWTPEAVVGRRPDGWLDQWLQRRLRDGDMAWRLRSEESEDTGIRVYTRFRSGGLASDCAVPVYTAAHAPRKLATPRQLALEQILPDRYCIVPKRRGAITDRGFADAGIEDLSAQGCEEYMWRGDPFALHLRGGPAELRANPESVRDTLWRFPAP
jgi:hypothetical protein